MVTKRSSLIGSCGRALLPPERFRLRSRNLTWTGSEPPRGSGWVHAQHFSIGAYGVPTRYREVVLTLSKFVTVGARPKG